jgi:ferredoxin
MNKSRRTIPLPIRRLPRIPVVKQENESADRAPEKPAAVDFHAPEFNVIDDLNDCAGDYRTFEPIDGIVTADMRHQMERRHDREHADPRTSMEAARPKGDRRQGSGPESPVVMPPLTIVSFGRTLIIDTDARRAEECSARLGGQGLECTVVLTKAGSEDDSVPWRAFWGPLQADNLSVCGAFGGFDAAVTVNGNRRPLAEWLGDGDLSFDLVLDLQPEPSYAGELLPAGYFSPGPDPVKLDEALAEMPEMRGRFVKPQFTAFLDSRCIHGLSRKRDCSRCLEICPFGAIQSVDRKIAVNPCLCQGCGACALVCPTDAIRQLDPPRKTLLEAMRETIHSRKAEGPPEVVISDSETAGDAADGGRIHFKVGQIGHAGLELLLSALAFGAGRISVACATQYPAVIRRAVEWQVQMAGAILQGLGLPCDCVRFAGGGAEDGPSPRCCPDIPPAPATLSRAADGRTVIRMAAQHLYDHSGADQPRLPMPEGTPFGVVAVDPAACTLCMACAVVCPSGALSAGRDTPRLTFIESRCHQCGLCRDACPENAMRLSPRILCDPSAVDSPAVLREAEPFRCVVCGAPFATQAMIDRMQDKLAGHWMYAGERQLRRLRMCRTCRTRDALTSEDVNVWNR